MTKTCNRCRQILPLESFNAHPHSKDGRGYTCRECHKGVARRWYEENKAMLKVRSADWQRKHPEKVKQYKRAWHERNMPVARAKAKEWLKARPELQSAYVAERRAKLHLATPAWANKFFIREFYHLAKLRDRHLGGTWHVDHIVPLRHPLVCGLHVEHNLQVMRSKDNQRKSNLRWPEMP